MALFGAVNNNVVALFAGYVRGVHQAKPWPFRHRALARGEAWGRAEHGAATPGNSDYQD